jgi:hypothetical protein
MFADLSAVLLGIGLIDVVDGFLKVPHDNVAAFGRVLTLADHDGHFFVIRQQVVQAGLPVFYPAVIVVLRQFGFIAEDCPDRVTDHAVRLLLVVQFGSYFFQVFLGDHVLLLSLKRT